VDEPRDTQRSRLYKAETALINIAKPLYEVRDVEKYVKRVLARQSILRRYPRTNPNVRVKDGRGTRRALAYGSHTISLPLWARNEAVVLHELAHTIAVRHYYREKIAGHGWQFAAILLDLVRAMMGKEAHDLLRASFKEHKVRYVAPRQKRELTPEQREELRARLAAIRAEKK
jgi:putative metallohydrolase (TIGR04338 family)